MNMNNGKKQIHLDIGKMRQRTQIENNLLIQINQNLEECFNDLKWINTNCVFENEYKTKLDSGNNKVIELSHLGLSIDDLTKHFVPKLFDMISNTFCVFQYCFNKRKDFMGMNLTGLIDEKVETGLSFRNVIEKMSLEQIKKNNPNIYDYANLYLDLEFAEQSRGYTVYKIKSQSDEYKKLWSKYGLDNYSCWYLIFNANSNKYSVFFEKI